MTDSDIELAQQWSNQRDQALEHVLGPMADMVLHATIPFEIGYELGGGTDIFQFLNHVDGVVSVTGDLIGNKAQKLSVLGNYELMICEPRGQEWGANLISSLAYYTLEAVINPFETMDLGSAADEEAQIVALLFVDYARFKIMGTNCGLLLCLGITEPEFSARKAGYSKQALERLKNEQVFPFTDVTRKSALQKSRSWEKVFKT